LKEKEPTYQKKKLWRYVIVSLLIVLFLWLFYKTYGTKKFVREADKPIETAAITTDIVNGIHVRTGLKEGEGLMTVIGHCTACHSAQLIIQNRMNKEQWNATIRWMQETQNLWDLGDNQEVIVNYLVNNYPVVDKGRRENLKNIEWYILSD